MAFDIHKLARAAEFSFSLASVGLVRCKSLSSDHMSQAHHHHKASEVEGKEKELARWLLGEVAKRPTVEAFKESDPIEGESLNSEQLAAITDQELESFSKQVLQKNRYLLKTHKGEELQRIEGQSFCEFLAHAIEHRAKEDRAQVDRIIQSATKPLFTDSTLDSIRKSMAASSQYENLIEQYAGGKSLADRTLFQVRQEHQVVDFPPIYFPKNPILETNQILENLTGQIEGMRPLVAQGAELIRSMNDTALMMQGDYIANSAQSNDQTKKAMKVAVWSLIFSAVGLTASSIFSYQSYVDGKANAVESKNQGDAFAKLTKDLMTAQHEDRVTLTKALVDMKQTVPLGKK